MYNYEKVASSSLKEAKDILRDIYEENPKHWPYGLYPEQMDGGLYLVREASTKEPVGFVGWQERIEDFKKVGYYSVGIKKAHRRSGYAKAAVKKLIQEKSARVDRVKALIVEGNTPSVGLAENLEVEVDMQKSAAAKFLPGALLGGGASALENEWLGLEPGTSKINTVLGALSGGVIGKYLKSNPKVGIGALVGYPAKSVGLFGVDQLAKSRKEQSDLMDKKLETAENYREMASLLSPYEADPDNPDSQRVKPLYAMGGLAAAGLGTGAVFASILNALRDKNKITIDNQERKDPNVLSVDIPKDKVSDRFYTSLNRDMLFSTPEEKREKLKDLLEDLDNPEKQAMTKKAASLLRLGANFLRGGKKLFRGGKNHFGNVAQGASKQLNPLKPTSLINQKGIGRLAGQYGLAHGGMYGADALGISNALGDGNWGNRFGNYLIEPFRDAARDFRGGNYGHALVNALYAPLHLGFNISGASALGKHALRQGGRGLSALGTTLTRTGGAPVTRGATAAGARFTKGNVPTFMQSLKNPNIARTQIDPNMSQTQLLGKGMEWLGGKAFGSSLAKGNADTLLAPLMRGYGRALGGRGALGTALGNIATAGGTFSGAALRNTLAKGGPVSQAIRNNPILNNTFAVGAPLAIGVPAGMSSRDARLAAWEAEQAERLQRRRERIALDEGDFLSNPEFLIPMLKMIGGEVQGPQMRSTYGT